MYLTKDGQWVITTPLIIVIVHGLNSPIHLLASTIIPIIFTISLFQIFRTTHHKSLTHLTYFPHLLMKKTEGTIITEVNFMGMEEEWVVAVVTIFGKTQAQVKVKANKKVTKNRNKDISRIKI